MVCNRKIVKSNYARKPGITYSLFNWGALDIESIESPESFSSIISLLHPDINISLLVTVYPHLLLGGLFGGTLFHFSKSLGAADADGVHVPSERILLT